MKRFLLLLILAAGCDRNEPFVASQAPRLAPVATRPIRAARPPRPLPGVPGPYILTYSVADGSRIQMVSFRSHQDFIVWLYDNPQWFRLAGPSALPAP